MAGFDANPYALYDAYGGPAFVAPARDAGTKVFDGSLIVGYAANPAPDIDHLATITTAIYARPINGVRAEFVVPVNGSSGIGTAVGVGDLRLGAAVTLVDGAAFAAELTPSVWLPTGSRQADFGAGVFGAGGVAAASVRTGRLEVVGNLGGRIGRVTSPHVGGAVAVDVARKLRVSAWALAQGDGASSNIPALVGGTARLRLGENFVVISGGKGVAAGSPDWQATIAFVPRPVDRLPVPKLDPLQARVRFEPDGDFTTEARSTMFQLAQAMVADPTLAIVVTGHSDPKLPTEASARRAQRVVDWLTWNGVPSERLSVLGLGGVDAVIAGSDPQNDWVDFARVANLNAMSRVPYPQ